MNWYKLAITNDSINYFTDFAEDAKSIGDAGEYVPDPNAIQQKLYQDFDTKTTKTLGQGDHGVAYLLDNNDVLKVTTNPQEAEVSQWILQNPHPNIAKVKTLWKDKDLYYIIKDFVTNNGLYSEELQFIENELDKAKCYKPDCAVEVVKQYATEPLKSQLMSYLEHLKQMPKQPYDFIGHDNAGNKGKQIIFFDIV